MKRRVRFKQTQSLEERLTLLATKFREEARTLPPGRRREILLRKARQNETVAQISDWIATPDMPPPI